MEPLTARTNKKEEDHPPDKGRRSRSQKSKKQVSTEMEPLEDLSGEQSDNKRILKHGSNTQLTSRAASLNPLASEYKPPIKNQSSKSQNNLNQSPGPIVDSVDGSSSDKIEPVAAIAKKKRLRKKPTKKSSDGMAVDAQAVAEDEEVEDEGESCLICMEEKVDYLAVGDCNHHICSMCAIRIRIKNKDNCCSLCKKSMDLLIVYNASRGLLTYDSFGLSSDDLYSVTPAINGDPQHKIIYSECGEHYRSIETIRALSCPIMMSDASGDARAAKVLCGERFASNGGLLKHMSDRHGGLTLCKLCVEHRPLFVSEHIVFTAASLKLHNKFGDTTLPQKQREKKNSAFYSDKNKLTAGHKLCQFCDEFFFDSAALYSHMQASHFTCFMCPPSMMFRYYATVKSLKEHYRSEHIVCELCDHDPFMQDSGMNVAFQTFSEYSGHMMDFHNLSANQLMNNFRVGVGMNSSSNAGGVRGAAAGGFRGFVDLDMGSANPNYTGAAGATGASSLPSQGGVVIPSNMQIAGRVTGSGRFASLSQAELAMQQHQNELNQTNNNNNKNNQKRGAAGSSFDENFPSLGGVSTLAVGAAAPLNASTKRSNNFPSLSASTGSSSAKSTSAVVPHPLSVVNKQQQARELAKQQQGEVKSSQDSAEERRLRRNLQLAESFYGAGSSAAAAALSSVSISSKVYLQSVMTSFSAVGTEYDLLRTLYPANLVSWGKVNMNELLKIEKKISTLLADKTLSSTQLKPMSKPMRTAVHNIAKFYYLNSYQFDAEPNCYCSLVKTVHSCLPPMVLSKAVVVGPFKPPEQREEQQDLPIIFVQLNNNSLAANANYSGEGGKSFTASCGSNQSKLSLSNIALASGVFTTAQILSKLLELVEKTDYYSQLLVAHQNSEGTASGSLSSAAQMKLAVSLLGIVKVKSSGANAFSIEFFSLPRAVDCFTALSLYLANRPVGGVLSVNSSKEEETSIFLGYFSIFPAFATSFVSSDGVTIAAESEEVSSEGMEDGWVTVSNSGSEAVTSTPYRMPVSTVRTSSETAPVSSTLGALSAAGAEIDDWEEFLAEHRHRDSVGDSLTAGETPVVPARYVPKRTFATLPDVATPAVASVVPVVSSGSTNIMYHSRVHSSVVNDPNTVAEVCSSMEAAVEPTEPDTKKTKKVEKKGNAFSALLEDDEEVTELSVVQSTEIVEHSFEGIFDFDSVVTSALRRRLYDELMQQPGLSQDEVLREIDGVDDSNPVTSDDLLISIVMSRTSV